MLRRIIYSVACIVYSMKELTGSVGEWLCGNAIKSSSLAVKKLARIYKVYKKSSDKFEIVGIVEKV